MHEHICFYWFKKKKITTYLWWLGWVSWWHINRLLLCHVHHPNTRSVCKLLSQASIGCGGLLLCCHAGTNVLHCWLLSGLLLNACKSLEARDTMFQNLVELQNKFIFCKALFFKLFSCKWGIIIALPSPVLISFPWEKKWRFLIHCQAFKCCLILTKWIKHMTMLCSQNIFKKTS